MNPIRDTLPQFIAAIDNEQPVCADEKGNWWIEGYCMSTIRWLRGTEMERLESVINAFNKYLDDLERRNDSNEENRIHRTCVTLLYKYMNSPNAWELDYRIRAIGYRLGIIPFEKTQEEIKLRLEELAQGWKRRQTFIRPGRIFERETSFIRDLSFYKVFVELLLGKRELQDQFFNWTLRDNNDPSIFVKLPATAAHMLATHFSAQVGQFSILKLNGGKLECKVEGGAVCDLRNLNEQVTLSHGYQLSVAEIFQQLETRETRHVTNIEILDRGITNWNAEHYGPYDPHSNRILTIDFQCPEWWRMIPHRKILTPEQLHNLMPYDWKGNLTKPDGKHWLIAVGVTTEDNRDIVMRGNHGFIKVALPNQDGNYKMYSFGRYTKERYPIGLYEELEVFFKYMHGIIVCLDGNDHNTHRDHEYVPVEVTEEQGRERMERIKRDILLGFAGKLPFQIICENCFEWGIDVMDPLIPKKNFKRVAYISPLDNKSNDPNGLKLKAAKKLPAFIIDRILNGVARYFGAFKQVQFVNRKGEIKWKKFKAPWDPARYLYPNPSYLLLQRRRNPAVLASS